MKTNAIATRVEWLSKHDAAFRLGVSQRRIDQLLADGTLRGRKVPQPGGGRDLTEVHSGSVERYSDRKEVERTTGSTSLAKQLQTLSGALAVSQQPAPITQKPAPRPWLSIAEAADYSGLPASVLRRMVENGTLGAIDVHRAGRGGRYRIRKLDLDRMEAPVMIRTAAG